MSSQEQYIRKLINGNASGSDKDFWEFLHDSYKGGKDYVDGDYLVRHSREPKTKYKNRQELASYTNFVAPVVDLYTSYIYSGNITRDIKVPDLYNSVVDKMKNNIDQKNSTINEFMQKYARWSMVYGRMVAIVDSPNFQDPVSLQQMEQESLTPYVSLYPPTSVVNWVLTSPGQGPRRLKVLVLFEGDDDSTKESFYKIWTEDQWLLVARVGKSNNSKIRIVDQGLNTLGKIPAISLTYKDGFGSDFDDGESLISDISFLAKRIYNLDSNAIEIIEHSAFPILEIPYREGDDKDLEIGVGNALPYDPNHPEARAAWLEPPHTSLAEILAWRNQVVEDIRAIAHTLGVSTEASTPESGVALEARMVALHSTLGAMSKKLEKAETMIFTLIARYLGIEHLTQINISYPKSFAVRDLSSDLDSVLKAQSIVKSPTYEKLIQKSVANKVLSKVSSDSVISQEDSDAINSEIQAGTQSGSVDSIINSLGA